ncbi:MAG: DUF502 domain-containing protein [Rhodospirillaceae bacterium]|jgi:uncharacterized membrane protein|nr:DUF502 domain-containing protein [Rhodospirillaceae bacterium]
MAEGPLKSAGFGLWARLRTYFFAGILITAPVSLTIYLAWLFISFVDEQVFSLLPPEYNPEAYMPFFIPGLGLLLVLVGLTLIGALTAGFLGRVTRQMFDAILNRLPVIRSLYSAINQIMETVLANKSTAFRECVLIEYPRRGIWTLGFITGTTKGEVQDLTEDTLINVFVPTTPNPTSGFLLFVPEQDVVRLKMPIEDGLKLVISGGMVTPPSAKPQLEAAPAGPPATQMPEA